MNDMTDADIIEARRISQRLFVELMRTNPKVSVVNVATVRFIMYVLVGMTRFPEAPAIDAFRIWFSDALEKSTELYKHNPTAFHDFFEGRHA